MKVEFLDAPAVKRRLARLMNEYDEFHWAVAWGSHHTLAKRLVGHHSKFRNVTFGIAFSQTDPDLVEALVGVRNVYVATKFVGGTYHPKVYGYLERTRGETFCPTCGQRRRAGGVFLTAAVADYLTLSAGKPSIDAIRARLMHVLAYLMHAGLATVTCEAVDEAFVASFRTWAASVPIASPKGATRVRSLSTIENSVLQLAAAINKCGAISARFRPIQPREVNRTPQHRSDVAELIAMFRHCVTPGAGKQPAERARRGRAGLLAFLRVSVATLARPDAAHDVSTAPERRQWNAARRVLNLNPDGRRQTRKYRAVVPVGSRMAAIGMFFELQLPRPWKVGDELRLFQNALTWAEIGDEIGIACAWAQEHHFLEEYSHSTAPEVFLAAVSQRTKRMRLGHGVALMSPAYNHPARVAERIATLDLVSGGRVEWGTGESSSRLELEGFGIEYIDKRAMWAEGLQEAARMMASQPYPGHSGKFFSMPSRNVVPKPVQRPHPPAWVACTNRDTLKLAARLGLGALTFAFMDAGEAKFWVEEYYEIFERECQPIARAVNPNVAMLAGVMCHEDRATAKALGIEGQQFFKWGLAHYYRAGAHVPGVTSLWELFQRSAAEPMAGLDAVGTPDDVAEHFHSLQDAGVDQVIMLQQAGMYRHEDICSSLRLIGERVLPTIIAQHEDLAQRKADRLATAIAAAMDRITPIETASGDAVEAYPLLWEGAGFGAERVGVKRALDAGAMWRLHVAGAGRSR